MDYFRRYRESIYEVDPRKWEQIIAGGYRREGYEVELTPRSGDKGRDVVAARRGVGSVRILDQVKAYRRGNLVTADEVRAMLGVITGHRTSPRESSQPHLVLLPRLMDDEGLARNIPYRLELKDRDMLLPWLHGLSARK